MQLDDKHEQIKIEVIEGTRIAAGETLVIVPMQPFTQEVVARLYAEALKRKFDVMILPPNCKVYIKESTTSAAVSTLGGYQPLCNNPSNPIPPGAE